MSVISESNKPASFAAPGPAPHTVGYIRSLYKGDIRIVSDNDRHTISELWKNPGPALLSLSISGIRPGLSLVRDCYNEDVIKSVLEVFVNGDEYLAAKQKDIRTEWKGK